MTTPQMTASETEAGTAALKVMIKTKLPSWMQAQVPQALLAEAVQVVVAAVDKVRDAGATK